MNITKLEASSVRGNRTVCLPGTAPNGQSQCTHCRISHARAGGTPTVKKLPFSSLDGFDTWVYSLLQQETAAPFVRAPSENTLFCHFQPIVDARTGDIFAYEALLRARNGEQEEVISAGQLFESCERQSLQHVLDQCARRTAIRCAASLSLPENLRVFINFLPNTIYNPEICLRTTMEAAEAFGISLEQLVFEVVETEKIPDIAHLRRILQYYQSHGAGVAIDDMGAGYSAAEYIHSLNPEFVKIDRDVLYQAEHGSPDLLQTIIAAAKSVGAKVVVEGIETRSQMQLAQDAGTDLLQGFLIARPGLQPLPITPGLFPTTSA